MNLPLMVGEVGMADFETDPERNFPELRALMTRCSALGIVREKVDQGDDALLEAHSPGIRNAAYSLGNY
jgi:hypothetical protein